MFVDSHCHLDRLELSGYDGQLAGALAEARSQGVGHMLCVSIDLDSYPAMLALVETRDDVSVSVGVHPSHRPTPDLTVEALLEHVGHPKVVAIGETGLDYHYNQGDLEWQRQQFRTHIRAARDCGRPLIVHSRDAKQDTLDILREEKAAEAGGVMHCFTEDWAMAEQAMELNFYISLSGIVTFKNAQVLKDVARRVPLDRLLIETDSPYLAPVPRRGKPNEPALVRYVAEHIAELRGTTVEAVAEATTTNFFRLFPLALQAQKP